MKQEARKPEGGFCLITAMALMRAWWAYRRSIIRLYDLRVWLACLELIARRCSLKEGEPARFTEKEIHALIGGVGERHVSHAIRRLEAANLIHWSPSALRVVGQGRGESKARDVESVFVPVTLPNERRLVPIPRRLIRFLAREGTRALMGTAFGHLLRCLFYKRGECLAEGTCKASWIADAFGMDERRVKAARKALVTMGWLIAKAVPQWTLNRHGAVMRVNLLWRGSSGARETSLPPPELKTASDLPPPNKNKKLSTRSEKPETRVGGPAGVQERTESRPELRDVKPNDLSSASRLQELFREAVGRGLVGGCEADRLKFFAAAERAMSVAAKNPCGLFVTLVRRGLWVYIRQVDEDAARRKLGRLYESVTNQPERASDHHAKVGRTVATPASDPSERSSPVDIRALIAKCIGRFASEQVAKAA